MSFTGEVSFPRGAYLVSKTDARGVITYANDSFIAISGFSKVELIGQNHNIVRHPDMPSQAFEDLWRTVKSGLPWRGIVKNRTKDGGYYWVDATVVPIRADNQTVGYMSVRKAPSRMAVEEADALYRKLRAGTASLGSNPPLIKRMTIRARLGLSMLVMAGLLITSSVVGIKGIADSNAALKTSYETDLVPTEVIGQMVTLMADNRAQLMLGLQHDEASPFAKMHDHGLQMHADTMTKNRDEIDRLLVELESRSYSPAVDQAIRQFKEARSAFVNDGIMLAGKALVAGDFYESNKILLTRINPLYAQVAGAAKEVQAAIKERAETNFRAGERRYQELQIQFLLGACGGLFLVCFAGWMLSRSIVGPFRKIIDHFDRISQGILTDDIDITGRDEAGQVLVQLATMQTHLKVMLDEVQVAARTIEQQAKNVEEQTAKVAVQSEEQRDRASSIAASTEEFSQSVRGVAESANQAATAATDAQQQVSCAQASMVESTSSTSRVVDAVQASSKTIAELDAEISKIGAISQAIKDIADQTNLLALNAAIEAARAGDMGRGFAVVADEVRKLAERTTSSTKDITATVSQIRNVTDAAVESMSSAVAEVEMGIGKIHESTTGLSQITKTSHEVTDMARHIAIAATEQAQASDQVASNMELIASLIDGNLVSVKAAKEAADALDGASIELRKVVGQFKLH